MAKSNSSKTSRGTSTSKSTSTRRHQPLSPPGGFSGKRTRYEQGGQIDW